MSALRFAADSVWKCQECGAEKRNIYPWYIKKYCSKPCYSKAMTRFGGSLNHNFQGKSGPRKCEECGNEFFAERESRRCCSVGCRRAYMKRTASGPCRKDNNHNEIVERLIELGCSVRDTSAVGRGFPDAVVGMMGRDFLMEIKNPKTSYGKAGLNGAQQKFADEWRGSKPVVIWSILQAEAWVADTRRRIIDAYR